MSSERVPDPVAAAAGIGFLLAGIILLLQELGVVAVSWSVVVPLLLVVAGAALVATAGRGRTDTR